jgi:hypothetical protein
MTEGNEAYVVLSDACYQFIVSRLMAWVDPPTRSGEGHDEQGGSVPMFRPAGIRPCRRSCIRYAVDGTASGRELSTRHLPERRAATGHARQKLNIHWKGQGKIVQCDDIIMRKVIHDEMIFRAMRP